MNSYKYYESEEDFGWKIKVSNTHAEELNNSLFIFLEENLVFLAGSFLFAACLCSSPAAATELLKKRPSVVQTITSISDVSSRVPVVLNPVVLNSVKKLGKRRRLGAYAETFYGGLLIRVFESENAARDKNVLRSFETLNFDLKSAKFQNSNINYYSRISGGALPSFSILQNGLKFVNYYFSRNSEKRNSKKENFDFSGFTGQRERERERSNISKRERFYSVPLSDMLPIGIVVCFILLKKDKLQTILTKFFEKVGLLERETESEKRFLRLKQLFVKNKYSIFVILISFIIVISVLKNKSLLRINPISLAFDFLGNIFGEYSRLVSLTLGASNRRTDEAINRLNTIAENDHALVQQLQHDKLSMVRKLGIEEQLRRTVEIDNLQCMQNNLDAQKIIGNLEFKLKQQKEFLEGLDSLSGKQQIAPRQQGLFGNLVNRIKGSEKENEYEMKYLDLTHY